MPFPGGLSSWDDAVQSRRPALAVDLGGAGKLDAPGKAPNVLTMPNAGDWNQIVSQLASLGQVCPAAVLLFVMAASPSVSVVASARQLPSPLVSGDFGIVRTGAGIYVITPPAVKLPISSFPPNISQADNTEIDRLRCFLSGGTYNVTSKLGATGTDCTVLITIY